MGNLSVPAESTLPADLKVPERKPVTALDYQPFIDKQKALMPVDPRESDKEFNQGRMQRALADAAGAAARTLQPGHSAGETIAAAASAFLGSRATADDKRRQETLDYQEALRAHEEAGIQLQFQAAVAQQQMATANNQIDYENAAQKYNAAIAAQQHHDAYGAVLAAAGRVKAEAAVNLAKLSQEQDAANTTVLNQNARDVWNVNNQNATARAPKVLAFDPATQTVSIQTVDEQGNVAIKQMPVGPLGQIEAENQVLGALGPELAGLKKPELDYAKLSKTNPDLIKTKVILDILKSGGAERVFDPNSPHNPPGKDLLDFNRRGFIEENLLPKIGIRSQYQQAIKNTQEAMRSIPAGSLTPQEYTARFNMMLAAQLAHMIDDKTLQRAAALNDPAVNTGLKYLGR
jgi:tetratricopeptide (TPR) repeat protein